MHQLKFIVGCLALSASVTGLASAQEVEPAAITPYADVRYRLELVDQDGLAEDATASTLRVRAGLRSAEWNGFSGVIEGEAILRLGKPRYNDTVNGLTALSGGCRPFGRPAQSSLYSLEAGCCG